MTIQHTYIHIYNNHESTCFAGHHLPRIIRCSLWHGRHHGHQAEEVYTIHGLRSYIERSSMTKACLPYTRDPEQLSLVPSTAIGASDLRPITDDRVKAGMSIYGTRNKRWYAGFHGRYCVLLIWKVKYGKFGKLQGIVW